MLHGLIERVGNLGVHDLEGLQTYNGPATEKRRRKRYLADGLPELPGVYIFTMVTTDHFMLELQPTLENASCHISLPRKRAVV